MDVRVIIDHGTRDEAGYRHIVSEVKTFVANSEEDLELIETHLGDYYDRQDVSYYIEDRHLLRFKED